MPKRQSITLLFRILVLALITLQLAACGGAGSTGGTDPADDIALSGSVGDGPVTGATVEIWSATGQLLGSVRSDNTASFATRLQVRGSYHPLVLKVSGGIDLVTGTAPDFQLLSVLPDRHARQVNINPFPTLIVLIAQALPGGIGTDNLRVARDTVMHGLTFGLDPTRIADPVGTPLTDTNSTGLIKASETAGEMVRRTRDRISENGGTADGDGVLRAIAADMQDGTVDGGARPARTRGSRPSPGWCPDRSWWRRWPTPSGSGVSSPRPSSTRRS